MFGFGFLGMMGNYEERKVDRYEKDGVVIDTAYVTDGNKQYETAIGHPEFNNGDWIVVESYDTKEEALIGHNKWVETMTHAIPNELRDCQNAEISQFFDSDELVFKRTISI
jgi:hypothetical protein